MTKQSADYNTGVVHDSHESGDLVGAHFSPTATHKKVHKQIFRGKYGP